MKKGKITIYYMSDGPMAQHRKTMLIQSSEYEVTHIGGIPYPAVKGNKLMVIGLHISLLHTLTRSSTGSHRATGYIVF